MDLQLGSQSSTGNMWKEYQKKLNFCQYYKNLSSRYNLLVQKEQVQDKWQNYVSFQIQTSLDQ